MEERNVVIGIVNIPGVAQVENYGDKDGQCSFSGHTGNIFNTVIDQFRHITNCSVFVADELGTLENKTGLYSGVIGAVQANKVKLSILPVYYPIEDRFDDFEYCGTVREDTMTMMTMYNNTVKSYDSDVLFLFASAPLKLWIGLLITFLILSLILALGYRLLTRRPPSRAMWIIFRAYLDDDNFTDESPFFVIYSIFISIGLFFAITYLGNSLSTDLVVVEEPIAVKNYQDAINRLDFKIGVSDSVPEFGKFKNPVPGTIQSEMAKHLYPFILTPLKFLEMQSYIVKQQGGIFGREEMAKGLGYFVLNMLSKKDRETIRALLVRDKNARKFTNAFIVNKQTPRDLIVRLKKVISRLYEHGQLQLAFDKVPAEVAAGTSGELLEATKQLLSSKVETDFDASELLQPLKLKNIKYFMAWYYTFIFLIVSVLIAEQNRKTARKIMRRLIRYIAYCVIIVLFIYAILFVLHLCVLPIW